MPDYSELEKKLDIKFNDEFLIQKAFVHKSYVNEHRDSGIKHNERLEFLGDAVLELSTTAHLFKNCPKHDEGKMTSFRSALVKGENLSKIAKELNLGKHLLLSHGEAKSGGRNKNYILANTMEALIGAIYLDQGYEVADKFIEKFILIKLDTIIAEELHIDAKSKFQEMSQDREDKTPHYELIEEIGPDHNKKFTMGAFIGDDLIATGEGSSKQNAEINAAENALTKKEWN